LQGSDQINAMPDARPVAEVTTLLVFLFAAWPEVKKKQVRLWLKHKCITVNGRVTSQFDQKLKPGDRVAVHGEGFAAPGTALDSGLNILHEDAALLVVEKPSGLLTMASEGEREKTAYFQLTDHVRRGQAHSRARIWIVHRLDRETSGLLVFAKTEPAKRSLQANWDQVEKRYQAVTEGKFLKTEGTLKAWLDESDPFRVKVVQRTPETRQAVTHYKVLKQGKDRAIVEIRLETGRRHQIRVQLAGVGCPIVGDSRYGAKTDPAKRLGLHATFLRLQHPQSGQPMEFSSRLPQVLQRLV
jgi:23S rRNA pseudouridine1911/1915/1917 synthase